MKNRLLLLCASAFVAQNLTAATTTCYKKDWPLPSTIELTKLEGGECAGKNSFRNMQQKGWYIKDIIIKPNKNGLDYEYILVNSNPVEKEQKAVQEAVKKDLIAEKDAKTQTSTEVVKKENTIKATEEKAAAPIVKAQEEKVVVAKKKKSLITKRIVKKEVLPLYPQITTITNVTPSTATINIGNLKVGQSGIVRHRYENKKAIIISDAYVISSSKESSTIKFIPFLGLKQNAIPTTNRKPQNGDSFVLNYLYDSSLLIAPDSTSFRAVRLKFSKQNFQHSDMFGAYLKIEQQPLPSKEMIQNFAIQEDLGTIFMVIDNKIYILDTKTFIILDVRNLLYLHEEEQMPFYTRIENIEAGILGSDWTDWFKFQWLADFFGDDSDKTDDEIIFNEESKEKLLKTSYGVYYKNILGVNVDRK